MREVHKQNGGVARVQEHLAVEKKPYTHLLARGNFFLPQESRATHLVTLIDMISEFSLLFGGGVFLHSPPAWKTFVEAGKPSQSFFCCSGGRIHLLRSFLDELHTPEVHFSSLLK